MDNDDLKNFFKDEFALEMFETTQDKSDEKPSANEPEEETIVEKQDNTDNAVKDDTPVKTKQEIERIKNEREKKVYRKLICALSIFLVFGFLLFLLFLSAVDKDKTVSQTEKRTLAQRPAFSFSALFSGEWGQDFENYYSDNFPLRDSFINVSKKVENFFTRFSFGEDDSVIVKVKRNEDDFGGEGLTQEEQDNTKPIETTSKRQEVTDKDPKYADENNAKISGSILIADKRAMEIFSYYDSGLKNYASIVNSIADSIGGRAKVYSLIAPTSIEFYGTKKYRTGSHSQKDAINSLYSMMHSNVETVDAYSVLAKNSDEYIYFRTDHHWTVRGAYCAYKAFCSNTGVTPVSLDSYTEKGRIPGDFLGTLYAQTKSEILASNPDYVEYFLPQGVSGEIYQSSSMDYGMSFYVVATNVNSSNKYLAFIAGDQPLEKITTQNKNGKKIIVLKESYGNAFVPFLCNDYEEVYVLDPRKLTFNLGDFVEKNSITDVLLINYAFGVFNPTYLEGLKAMAD